MPRVVHFEIGADQPERASKFYSSVFGWKINKWEGPQEYWLADTGGNGDPGINGGLLKRKYPGHDVVNTIGVPKLDEYIDKVTKSGGKLMNKQTIPGVGYLAYCTDTEGNTFGMMQSDENAK